MGRLVVTINLNEDIADAFIESALAAPASNDAFTENARYVAASLRDAEQSATTRRESA